jgi:glycosyltransferase involved in cell wall biosynthesis
MLICHINLASDYRGGERQAELLVRELSRRGYRQRLIIRRGNELKHRCADIADLEVVEVASNPIAAAFAARGSDILQLHEGRSVYSGLMASIFLGIPYVITRRVPNPRRSSWVRALAYRKAASVVAISKAVAKGLGPGYGYIDFDFIPDAHAALESNETAVTRIRERHEGKLLIGHVGAYDHSHKGQWTIIEAANAVREKHPDWYFILCGSGRDETAFRKAIADLDNIELTGFVDNIGDYYASFDVFVFPSQKEGIGSAMIDAMYFGLPIVASNVDGIPEFIDDGVHGRLIERGSVDQLVAGIEEIVAKPEWAAAARAACLDKASSLDAKAMADGYEAVYRRVLKT